jgi:ABC-2 type transport system ATP-binding protein
MECWIILERMKEGMGNAVVSVEGLVKRYGSFAAVDGISFDVKRGEVFGLLGPNGAGKTSALECIEGMRRIDGGRVTVAGCDVKTSGKELRSKLGVQLQASSLPDTVRATEAMELICAWHGLKLRLDLIERFGLDPAMKQTYAQMSTGQKRRLNLALAMAANPEAVILDEPTAGLDVQGRAQLHKAIREVKAQGVTLLLATHDMAEAETLCDRVAIMVRGRIVTLGTPAEVTAASLAETRITLLTRKGSLLPGRDFGDARFKGAAEGYCTWLCRDVADAVMLLLQAVKDAGDTVEDLRVERPSLEERFLELMEGGTN